MKVVGQWYFPELNHKEYFGTFYKEDNRLKLHIIGELPWKGKMVRFPVIYGNTTDGKFTLIDCIWSKKYKYNNQSKIVESSLSCQSVIKGHCFNDESEMKFNEFKFNFAGLKEWCNLSTVDESIGFSKVEASFINPEPINFDFNSDIRGCIEFEMSSFPTESMHYNAIYQIRHSVFLKFISKNEINLKVFIDQRNSIMEFFLFSMNYNIEPFIQRIYNYSIPNDNTQYKTNKELIFIENRPTDKINFSDRHIFPFKLTEIQDSFKSILKLWIEKHELLKPITNIFHYFIKENLNIENKFILACQALETFHARFRQNHEEYTNTECNSYKNKETSEKTLTPKFKIRIQKLLEYFKNNISDVLFDKDEIFKYPQIITDTRDYYTHYLKNLENEKWNNSQLLTNTPKLIMVLHTLILKEV